MRKFFIMLAMTALSAIPAFASVSVNIGINVPYYPALQRIDGYPVYYVPHLHANYFFYDGLYWVYVPDGWFVSPWYNGPWEAVDIDSVPLFVLRVPLRYYGYPPEAFRHWVASSPPRWDAVWGPDWARRHDGWQRWNRTTVPPPAPLPRYQRRFSRDNYPNDVQRRELIQKHYNYAPRDTHVRQQWQTHVGVATNQPHAQPSPSRPSQSQLARPHETHANDPGPVARNDTPTKGHAPPRRAPISPPEQPRPQGDAHQADSVAIHDRAEQRGPNRNVKQEFGGRHDRPNRDDDKGDKKADHKPNKQSDHESDKQH